MKPTILSIIIIMLCAFNTNAQNSILLYESPYVNNSIYDTADTLRVNDFYHFRNDDFKNTNIETLKKKYDVIAMLLLDTAFSKEFLDVDTTVKDYFMYERLQNQYLFFNEKVNSLRDKQFYKVVTTANKTPKENIIALLGDGLSEGIMDTVCQSPEKNSLILIVSIKDSAAVVHVRSRYRDGYSKYHMYLDYNHLVVTPLAETIDFEEEIKFAKKEKKVSDSQQEFIKRSYKQAIKANSYGLGIKFGVGMSRIAEQNFMFDPICTGKLAYSVGLTYDNTYVSLFGNSIEEGDDGYGGRFNNVFMQVGLYYSSLSTNFVHYRTNQDLNYTINNFTLQLKPFGHRWGLGHGNSVDLSLGLYIGLMTNSSSSEYDYIPSEKVRFNFGVVASAGVTIIDYIHLSANYNIGTSTFDSYAHAFHLDYPLGQSVLLFNVGFNFGPLMAKNKNKDKK